MSVDLNVIKENFSLVEKINEIVGTWEFWIDDCPVNPIKVKVYRDAQGMYTGIANYFIQNPDQASPYRSMNPTQSLQEALKNAIGGFLSFYHPERRTDTIFIKDDDF